MNIVTVDFNNCVTNRSTFPLYQYDYGQILKIEGIELPLAFQAHFCNVGDTQTITQIGQDGQVAIPDELLLNSKGITCYIYLHTGENDGETEYRINIPVNQRPAPSDEEPTPVQQSAIDQAIAALNNGVTLAEGFAEQAGEYSVVAQQASANAEDSEANAKTSEDNAKLSEENASQSELNAGASEENAHTSEVNAKASEIEAGLSADDAADSATSAQSSERLARTYSENASRSADSAQGYAETAQEIAENIQSIVDNALEEAKQSGEFDGVGIASVVLNPDYTLTINFTDGTSTTTSSIRGEQGEKGDTGEKGETGETGVGISSITKTGTSGNVDTYTITFTNGSTSTFEVTNGTIQSVNGKTGANVTLEIEDIPDLADTLEEKAGILEDTVSGSIVSFTPDKTIENLKGVIVDINPVQAGSGEPSPDNIRPISGWNECKVMRAGVNLINHTNEDLPKTASGVSFSRTGGDYIVTATAEKTGYPFVKIGELDGLKAGTYTLSYSQGVNGISLRIIDRTVTPVQTIAQAYSSSSYVHTFMLSEENSHTLSIEIAVTATSLAVGTYTIHPMLELGSTATSYSPYQGSLYTISLGQTVYGGRLDVTRGELVVEKAKITYNGSENGWTAYASYEGYYITNSIMKNGTRQDGTSNLLKNQKDSTVGQKNTMWLGVNSKNIFVIGVYETMGSTLQDFKNYLNANNLEIVYPLATPITISLTPTQISSLKSLNTMYADTGNISVDYAADLKTYILNAISNAL